MKCVEKEETLCKHGYKMNEDPNSCGAETEKFPQEHDWVVGVQLWSFEK